MVKPVVRSCFGEESKKRCIRGGEKKTIENRKRRIGGIGEKQEKEEKKEK